ncbi:xaa-Arg dipeptidase-like isoform X1 [Argiope bruennichi]|uniref:xaa-Arg dipeptidase-like isoform X1 n=1 Tax=Argiope bruennichi TaxID=94029 RepID=UPI00249541AB|nr:xaa-Arg dipeptidase-like isoform X1 [Argiope bruennichi]
MSEKDFEIVCAKIEDKKEFLNSISQEIWKMPELNYKEVQAHAVLTCALKRCGFQVQKHYFMPTAFRAEFCPKKVSGPTVAILLEYDALPEIGHACGHNLIAEAGLAAAIAVKAAMEEDADLKGKLVVMGTPAEEGGGGKIRLLELGAFEGIDSAMMVHPAKITNFFPRTLCNVRYSVQYKGKEAHAGACPWEGRNALDAAVSCYLNIAQLRQHLKPSWKIQAIITKGGTIPNIIPSAAEMEVHLRTPTRNELKVLRTRAEACFTSAATATGCEVQFRYDEANAYENLITNKVLANIFKEYAERLGLNRRPGEGEATFFGSTDMGNISHVVPAIHCFYSIPSDGINHTRCFTEASGAPEAQPNTLLIGKVLAMTTLKVFKSPEVLEEVKKQFEKDITDE